MDWIQELAQNKSLCCSLTAFLGQHGFSGLEKALQLSIKHTSRQRLPLPEKIYDIYCLEIQTHIIAIHIEQSTYQKYSSLTDEPKSLAPYGFIRCRQNCPVSLEKI